MLTTHKPALVTAAELPHPPSAATGQLLTVKAAVLGGVKLCIDVWQLIPQKSSLWTGPHSALPCSLWAACLMRYPQGWTRIPLTMLCAHP